MSSSKVKSAALIGRHIRSGLADIGYRRPGRAELSARLRGFWDPLTLKRGQVEIISDQEFRIYLPQADYYESLRRDFFDGATRVARLNTAAAELKKSACASAWILTTVYYAAFFSAIELLRAHGRYVSYQDKEDVAMLHRIATRVNGTLTPSTYVGDRSIRLADNTVEITFRRQGDRPHVLAWQQYRPLVVRLLRSGEEDPAGMHLLRIIPDGADDDWPNPSHVRNRWNYSEANLFGVVGETTGRKFVQFVNASGAALAWPVGKKVLQTDESEAASIAFLNAHLLQVMSEVATAILADNQVSEVRLN